MNKLWVKDNTKVLMTENFQELLKCKSLDSGYKMSPSKNKK